MPHSQAHVWVGRLFQESDSVMGKLNTFYCFSRKIVLIAFVAFCSLFFTSLFLCLQITFPGMSQSCLLSLLAPSLLHTGRDSHTSHGFILGTSVLSLHSCSLALVSLNSWHRNDREMKELHQQVRAHYSALKNNHAELRYG